MKEITLEKLKICADKLYFSLSDEELNEVFNDFKVTLSQMEMLNYDKDVDSYEPMVYPFEVSTDLLRDDVAIESTDRADALKNAKNVVAGQIKIGKVVG